MNRRRLIKAAVPALIAPLAATSRSQAAFRDKDCADFRTQRAAQRFFRNQSRKSGVRDRHGLDGDGDGIACESLP